MAAVFPLPEISTAPGTAGSRLGRRPARRAVVVVDAGRARRVDEPVDTVGRVLVACAALAASVVLVLGVAVMFSALDARSQPPVAGATPTLSDDLPGPVVVVQQGDTLTSIARDLQPSGDIGPLVDRLAALHGPAPLLAGERIPVGSVLPD